MILKYVQFFHKRAQNKKLMLKKSYKQLNPLKVYSFILKTLLLTGLSWSV